MPTGPPTGDARVMKPIDLKRLILAAALALPLAAPCMPR